MGVLLRHEITAGSVHLGDAEPQSRRSKIGLALSGLGFRVLCLWLFLSLVLPVSGWQSDSQLKIERIRLGTDAEVAFETQPGIEDPDAASEIQLEPQPVPRSTTD